MSVLVSVSPPLHPSHLSDGPVILVVDDEAHIRDMLDRFLHLGGFQARFAVNGRDAVRLYEEYGDEIDLVLLDIRMPQLTGPETLAALKAIDPAVRCCFMTGYPGDYTPDELRAGGALHIFQKPFRFEDIIDVLRRLTAEDE